MEAYNYLEYIKKGTTMCNSLYLKDIPDQKARINQF